MDAEVSILARLNRLIDIGIALSTESDRHRLLERILCEAKALTLADAGSLYTVRDADTLVFEYVRNDTLGLQWSRNDSIDPQFPDVSLSARTVVAAAATKKSTICIPDAYASSAFDFSGTQAFDARTGYRSKSFLTIPMLDHEKQLIGVLQLINARDPETHAIVPFSYADQHLAESLASLAASALGNRLLIDALKEMLESFVTALAEAIDDKSPHTGGHCRRVPIVADALARALNRTRTGPLANVKLSEEQLYELHIAALLHDCGKVVTPTHIIDKATRLETVRDGIAEIAARFEIVKRDIEISRLRGMISSGEVYYALQSLKADLDYVIRCNQASANMGDDVRTKLERIAARTYADRDGVLQPLLTASDIDNLSIPRGTLNSTERTIIEDHIVSTQKMLGRLRYPANLRNVPEIAGAHHERMDGTGYPHGLTGDQMSVQARVLAIADVFEALTAPDRPYRQPLPLSRALAILSEERDRGKLDPDLYDVFMKEQVYMSYAREHLSAQQMDL